VHFGEERPKNKHGTCFLRLLDYVLSAQFRRARRAHQIWGWAVHNGRFWWHANLHICHFKQQGAQKNTSSIRIGKWTTPQTSWKSLRRLQEKEESKEQYKVSLKCIVSNNTGSEFNK
jgi:hypothetical protein